MGKWCPKHVEALNPNKIESKSKSESKVCIKLVVFITHYPIYSGPGSSGGIATSWTVRGSNPGGGEIFRTRSDRPWGPPNLLYNGFRVFPGGKAAGAWCWPPTPSSAEVENE
jgi:hypothetical protein